MDEELAFPLEMRMAAGEKPVLASSLLEANAGLTGISVNNTKADSTQRMA
jgi:hypothetical protein